MTCQDPGDEPQVKKKRGGQPGNTNALKHGFYSRKFRTIELDDLDVLGQDLESEIALLRVIMRRVFELGDEANGGVDHAINVLYCLGMGASTIAGLMRTQKIMGGDGDHTMELITRVIDDVNKSLGRGER